MEMSRKISQFPKKGEAGGTNSEWGEDTSIYNSRKWDPGWSQQYPCYLKAD